MKNKMYISFNAKLNQNIKNKLDETCTFNAKLNQNIKKQIRCNM